MKIADLVVGNACEITLVVKSATARETRAKKPYLALEFYDGTDTINGNYWDWASGNIPAVNTILDVRGQVTEWQGNKQLNVSSLKTNKDVHISAFMPTSGVDVMQTYKDAYDLMCQVYDDALRTIALGALDELRQLWITVPGAKAMHHAYIGGTLVHSYGVAKLAKAIAANVPEANADLCVVGGMLHDLGKLFTYTMDGISIGMSDEGMLYEHVFMGAEFVGNFADSHVDLDSGTNELKVRLLRHIILSHHGKLEYGSPVLPMCIEAHIVSAADMLDASIEQVRTAARKAGKAAWTDKIYPLGNRAHITPSFVSEVFKEALPF